MELKKYLVLVTLIIVTGMANAMRTEPRIFTKSPKQKRHFIIKKQHQSLLCHTVEDIAEITFDDNKKALVKTGFLKPEVVGEITEYKINENSNNNTIHQFVDVTTSQGTFVIGSMAHFLNYNTKHMYVQYALPANIHSDVITKLEHKVLADAYNAQASYLNTLDLNNGLTHTIELKEDM